MNFFYIFLDWDMGGWKVTEMLAANSKLLGFTISADNP